jgi:hypothetical protein
VPLTALVGDIEPTKANAFHLARRLLDGEPLHRGLQQMGVFEEVIVRDLVRILHTLHLHRFLVAAGFRHVTFLRPSAWATDLARAREHHGGSYTIETRSSNGANALRASVRRSAGRMAGARFSRDALRLERSLLLHRIDPYHRRQLIRPSRLPAPRGCAWFYSTAHNYTTAGLFYEPFAPAPFHFLVENAETGGVPLRARGRAWTTLYEFLAPAYRPGDDELRQTAARLTEHVRSVPLSGEAATARDLFLEGAWFRDFIRRLLGLGLFHASLHRDFLDRMAPQSIWVGNPGWERLLLVQATQRGIPTVLVQHGLLGDYCQFSDPPVQHYVVRGAFWLDFLSSAARKKAAVLNPPESFRHRDDGQPPAATRHVMFLTADYRNQDYMHVGEIDQLLHTLVAATLEAGRPLVVRVHPRNSLGEYRSRVATIARRAGLSAGHVRFSQGGGLDRLVDESCAVVTYYSTVFLDCVRRGVPLISFGWHHFSYKPNIEPLGVYHFAKTFDHCRALICEAAAGRLRPYTGDARVFLASTPPHQITETFQAWTGPLSGAASGV